jgi:hypothetical protein
VAEPDRKHVVVGSTDMGNVSYVVPAIHPMVQSAPLGVPIHTPEFAHHAASPQGDDALVHGATALAWTVADLWLGDGVLDSVKAEFEATMAAVGDEARTSAIRGGSGA